jgi:hypothetical protein
MAALQRGRVGLVLVSALGVRLWVIRVSGALQLRLGCPVAGIAAQNPPAEPDDSK